ncbi:hypothetical protein P2G88_08955 [Aliiglaciecola sp. CAU 1673]|uniref:hypothetical protein n=1 Tax=Aliiglaciecola sp. CAU 1673 TaxID=3032595 RepID=UPI0023DC01B0|nr:hypothetical protein [Aliiglaciecola sp. CAU 1673]MDF2178379.1 hypothetical protein [Aliiglaciecola sp. CAU 1673]
MELLTGPKLWELIKHLKQWLTNLNRANEKRQAQSVAALRSVIVAARNTAIYLRQVQETGKSCHNSEAKLSEHWTRLGFELTDLGLSKLAKRCDITGRFWAEPKQFDQDFLAKADVGLARMEQLARQMLAQVTP